jgi:tryptophanyl-tRNA synthetase
MYPDLQNKIILTGVKPTGTLHLGNYVGAIKPAIDMANMAKQSYMFIADYHALNQIHDAKELCRYTQMLAAAFLALGLDTNKIIFYRQSDIPEDSELSLILTAVTPKGLMNRSHAYKAEIDRNREAGREDVDIGINMGLYTYPILMAADILLFESDIVPVGKDQIQHIEFARDIAGHFNSRYGDVIKLPTHFVPPTAAAIPGLDGRKMSKSYSNTIPLFENSATLRKAIMKIVSDSKLPEEPKDPDSSTIFQLYTAFAAPEKVAAMRDAFLKGGMGYGTAKELLFEAIDTRLAAPREKYNDLMKDTAALNSILKQGAEKARTIARPVLTKIRKAAGIE